MRLQHRVWLYRLLLLAAILGLWQVASDRSQMTRFFFGSPVAVGAQIVHWAVTGTIYRHLGITLLETLLAFSIGTVLALVIGLWLALDRLWSGVLDPFIKGVNTMPRLILAPIFSVWFGLGIWSKVALGVTIVFFIVFFNVYQGIKDVSPILLANVRMLGASRAQLVRRLYIPSAMSWVFSSLHLSVGMAFVGVVIGEYLGSAAGVGYLILQAESTFEINTVIAGIVVLTGFALLLDSGVTLVESALVGRFRPRAAEARAA